MLFKEYKHTDEFIGADVIEFVDTNGETLDIDVDIDAENADILDNINVVDTHLQDGLLEIALN